MVKHLNYTIDAVLNCYKGQHDTCRKYSLVCGNTIFRSPYYRREKFQLNICPTDEIKLRNLVGIRLSPQALKSTYRATTTQKCEAVNKSCNRVNPKGITFSRTYPARIHTSIHYLNNGFANSLILKKEAVDAPVPTGSKVAASLLSLQLREKYFKNRNSKTYVKMLNSIQKRRRYDMYFQRQEQQKRQPRYVKNIGFRHFDHQYTKCINI